MAVLSDRDLQLETLPAVTGLEATELSVAWSQDGRQLFAEGYHLGHWDRLARRWDKGLGGGFIDITGARNMVMQFVPLRGNRMLFTDQAGFGLIDASGKVSRLEDRIRAASTSAVPSPTCSRSAPMRTRR